MKKGKEFRQTLYMAVASTALLVAFFGLFIGRQQGCAEHECRFWGIIFSQNDGNIKNKVKMHLDSLRSLGAQNRDGWGIGFFIRADSLKKLPVIARGGPSAPLDPRFDNAMEDIIRYCSSSGVAHVRRGSSGPTGGIPDPHPFRRKCVNRNIEFLLAHNGTIPIFTLMDLIQTINPLYLDTNPPDYSPDYIDSDLYSIYLAEVLDTYFDSTVESCIRIAVVKLDSALNTASGEMNFVMSDGNAMLVLNYTLDPIEAITAYYSPDTASSDFWAAASEPLDTFSGSWVEIPNKTLVTLKPGEAPVFTRICRVSGDMPLQTGGCAVSARTVPFNRTLLISYRVPRDSPVVLAIHDSAGRLVRTLVAGIRKEGEYTASWDGTDDAGKTLASGTYFCLLKAGDQEAGLKTILAR